MGAVSGVGATAVAIGVGLACSVVGSAVIVLQPPMINISKTITILKTTGLLLIGYFPIAQFIMMLLRSHKGNILMSWYGSDSKLSCPVWGMGWGILRKEKNYRIRESRWR